MSTNPYITMQLPRKCLMTQNYHQSAYTTHLWPLLVHTPTGPDKRLLGPYCFQHVFDRSWWNWTQQDFALTCSVCTPDTSISQLEVTKKSIKSLFWHLGSSKVIALGGNWKLVYDFLLVINSNLGSILHHFWDTASYWPKITNFLYPHLI